MRLVFHSPLVWVLLRGCSDVIAQTYDTNAVSVQTFAGSGFYGYVDGVGEQTMFNGPNAIVSDSRSNLFVWDSYNYRIRKITPDSNVSTFAGGGGQTTGIGTNVSINIPAAYGPAGMAMDRNDTIWLLGPAGSYLYKVTAAAVVTFTNLPSSSQHGLCVDSRGNIYTSDFNYNKIYQLDTNSVFTVFAGSGNPGYADGNGIFTAFNSPGPLAVDAADNIYVWDAGNFLIRRIDQNRNVTTLAGRFQIGSSSDGVGTNASFSGVLGMSVDASGDLLLACGSCVRRVSATTNVTTVAGSFTQSGYTNGLGSAARFSGASSLCVSQGAIFVADSNNQRMRNISYSASPQPLPAAQLGLGTYAGLSIAGLVGRTYRIESSSNMAAWSTEATILLTRSPYLWFDQGAFGSRKFYRAFLLP